METQEILCPICDEALGFSKEDLPEKCPICDTRRHEILQDLEVQSQDGGPKTMFLVENSSPEPTPEPTSEPTPEPTPNPDHDSTSYGQLVVEEMSDSVDEEIEESKPYVSYPDKKQEDFTEDLDDIVFNDLEDSFADEGGVVFETVESTATDDFTASENHTFETVESTATDDFAAPENHTSSVPEIEDELAPDFTTSPVVTPQKVEEKLEPVYTPSVKEVSPEVKSPAAIQEPKKIPVEVSEEKEHIRTGASSLEVLPGENRKFPAGNYLILYNAERKAIAYFRLDNAGSVIIGRSSERGSQSDIDLTMAWRHYYKKQTGNFQEKMALVKGISRKHALIRYAKEKQSYVFFHLSDKNYSVLRTKQGEKRQREPGNRNPITLESGTLISMGNQRNFIAMRFKAIV